MFSPRILIRVAVYLAVIAALFLVRSRGNGSFPFPSAPASAPAESTLVVAGASLAPELLREWTAGWGRNYPTRIVAEPGGTSGALEALLEGRAGVALLVRAPTREEEALRGVAHGDTIPCYPVAFGALRVLGGRAGPRTEVSTSELRDLLEGRGGATRLYLPDPNSGWCDALRASLGLPAARDAPPGVVFLADPESVAVAVARDPAALGVVSALAAPATRDDVVVLPVRAEGSVAAAHPDDASVADGTYPLAHHLYAACLPEARGAAVMFLTYLTSAGAQRLAERAGFLPARRVAREVYLTTHALKPSS